MKARSPLDEQIYYFIDKCLPFGTSISCSHFQHFSNAVAFLVKRRTKKPLVNYLDDYFFAALTLALCNGQMEIFMKICEEIRFPVSATKTFWGSTLITFLGFLIDSVNQTVSVPAEKIQRAKELIDDIVIKRKITVYRLQKLCGFLNFLCHCIVPGRAFTRRLYAYYTGNQLKVFNHINVLMEMKKDLAVWRTFLDNPQIYCRPFKDFDTILTAEVLNWHTDASGTIGYGGIHEDSWFAGKWSMEFLKLKDPSIEFQELYAVAISIFLWSEQYRNRRICLFCDNQAVFQMINNATSSCKNCMVLIRKITLHCLEMNIRIFAKFVLTKDNCFADALSRGQMSRFWTLINRAGKTVKTHGEEIPNELMCIEQWWMD